MTPSVAGESMNQLPFEYDTLAPVEKKVMRRLVPFYTFSSRNLPLQLQTLATRPGSISAQLRPLAQNTGQYIPNYLASGAVVPSGPETDGKQRFISQFGTPVEEALQRLKFKDGLPDV